MDLLLSSKFFRDKYAGAPNDGSARLTSEQPQFSLWLRQDTNGLAFHTLPLMLGVSKELDLIMNSLAVPRKAKQAIGGITKLTKKGTNEVKYVFVLFFICLKEIHLASVTAARRTNLFHHITYEIRSMKITYD